MNLSLKFFATLFLVFNLMIVPKSPQSQVGPVVLDAPLNGQNGLIVAFQTMLNILLNREEHFIGTINEVHDFIKKANTLVNTSVKNLRLIKQIINLHNDIIELQNRYVNLVNLHIDLDNNGNVSLAEVEQQWKGIQVSLGLLKEALHLFQIFDNVLSDELFTMDDKGRVQVLQETYSDLIAIKSAMRIHIRRSLRKSRDLQAYQREYNTFVNLFSKNWFF